MVPAWLTVFFVLYGWLAIFSPGSYGGGDSYNHYLISRFSFQHPELFMHQWGKPFFTLLSSPFSQFGFIGIKFFNIILTLSTAYVGYKIIGRYSEKNNWLSVVFICCSPIFFYCTFSGLTEILFAFMLVMSIWLYLDNKTALAFLLISFHPFVRSEGFLMLPLFGLLAIANRQFKYIPLLALGTLTYALAGFIIYNDINWVFASNPYLQAGDVYGHGGPFHFIGKNEELLGEPQVILFLIGTCLICYRFIKNFKSKNEQVLFFLILGSFGAYFIAHSIFWWKGIFGSLGLTRVFGGVGPVAAIVAYFGFQGLIHYEKLNLKFRQWLSVLFVLWILWVPFKMQRLPFQLNRYEKLHNEAIKWFKQQDFGNRKIYFFDPYLCLAADFDIFDTTRYVNIDMWQGKTQPDNCIIYWESYYCPNEGHVKKEFFKNNGYQKLIEFRDPTLITYKKDTFEIIIYKK